MAPADSAPNSGGWATGRPGLGLANANLVMNITADARVQLA